MLPEPIVTFDKPRAPARPLPAAFLTPLDMRKIGDRRWSLLEDLVFRSAKYRGLFIAPRGAEITLASIPRIAFTAFPPIGSYDRPAAIHDCGYGNALLTAHGDRIFTAKHVIDDLFLEGMIADKTGRVTRTFMYRAVKIFGDPDGHPMRELDAGRVESQERR